MHILTGTYGFRARETSGGYKHPQQVEGLVPPRFVPGELLPCSPPPAASTSESSHIFAEAQVSVLCPDLCIAC